jgi:CheY-like chemotaxis protein
MAQTLLVADDSKTMQRIVTMAFESSPFRVVAVGSGAEALQAAYEHRPAAILLDYHLPDRSGLDVCRALKGDPSLRDIPVVLMGGSYHPFSEDDARRQGSDDVILKPFRTDQILDKIRTVTGAHGPQTAVGMPAVGASVPPVVTPLPRPAQPPTAPNPAPSYAPAPSAMGAIPGRGPVMPSPRAPLIPPLPGAAPAVPAAQSAQGFELPPEAPRPRNTMVGMPSVVPPPGVTPPGNVSTFPGAPSPGLPAAAQAPRYGGGGGGGRLPPPVGGPGAAPQPASRYPGTPNLPVTTVATPAQPAPAFSGGGGSGALPMPDAFNTHSSPASVPSQPSHSGTSQLGSSQPSIPAAPLAGVDRELLRQLVREEVQNAVRTEMLTMVKSVLGDLFKEKMLPKLLSYGQERIDAVVTRDLQSIMERRVEEELQKLTSQ